ncbi:AbrB/MazE/SpoVT family DNA-binding domain-containing protein [Desulfonatronospira sp.]|uniref:AbrB/MazE/SpoVT family DNA-binding domain-containing protein n=1 Tax=Desulfonatronospira sp. TaxID=1962951 RepID=UPI0025BC5BC2|nr:AbrB/MazE/SpoVT family DNA-binding domain-containing protein [Desulfonatronospira sp.]
MEAKAIKVGNRLAFIVPEPIAEKCGIFENTSVDISLRDGEIVVRPQRKKYILSELLAEITPDNIHKEVGSGEPVGQEML